MDRTALYLGILATLEIEMDNSTRGKYATMFYKLYHIRDMIIMVQDMTISDRELSAEYSPVINQMCKRLIEKLDMKLSSSENYCS